MYTIIDTDPTLTAFDQIVPLDGREYLLEFFWSEREECWYMHVSDQDGSPLAQLVRLVVDWPILRRFRTDPRMPPGLLFCPDLSGAGADIAARTDLGERVPLVYITADDPDLAA